MRTRPWKAVLRATLVVLVATVISRGDRIPLFGAQQPSNADPTGRAVVTLPDGRVLITGGAGVGGPLTDALIRERTGETRALPAGLVSARAGHTATVLPDGRVLIFGGIDDTGQPTATGELFDPSNDTFSPVMLDGATPRAYHTATLLTDGSVLFAGGAAADGQAVATAERWDSDSTALRQVGGSLGAPRQRHSATLQSDGTVLLTGGAQGDAPLSERYDPATDRFSSIVLPLAADDVPGLAASVPLDGAVDVPLDVRIALRFATPLDAASLTATTVRLTGTEGAVAAAVVPTENGKLLFVRPFATLNPLSSYAVSIDGAATVTGAALKRTRIAFTTGAVASTDLSVADDHNGLDSPWRRLPPLQAPPGVTALSGQVLLQNGQPLADVTLDVEGRSVRTDRTGRFLLQLEDESGRSELLIDGRSASTPGRTFGVFEVGVALKAAETFVLPYTIWMPRIDTGNAVTIASPTNQETVITTPQIPGLEVRIPAGTVIRDHEGQVVRQVSITPIPVDRPPFPLPADVYVPIYFTVQPGGAYLYSRSGSPAGARLVYPNYRNEPVGKTFDFWHYDPEDRGWYVYGQGAVAASRTQIVPNAGVQIYEFTGAMVADPNFAPQTAPNPCNDKTGGDPVDLGTGLFVMENTDLFVPDVIPLSLTRTYRTLDSRSRPFGVGATHPYEIFMVGDKHPYTYVDVILPDGGRVHYDRISPGTEVLNAVYEHVSSCSPFYKSRIQWNGLGWDLSMVGGLVYVFPEGEFAAGPNEAALIGIRDRFGNKVTISRPDISAFGSPVGNITRITSPSGRFIDFTYGSGDRVSQAVDNQGRTVSYQYDTAGRLIKVTDPQGGITEYTYDTAGRMQTLKNPRNIVYLTNEYDVNGRVQRQIQADNSTWEFAYTLNASKVVQADVTDPRGFVRRVTFGPSGYWMGETRALGQPEQSTVTLERAATSQFITAVIDPLGRRTEFAFSEYGRVTSVTRLALTPQAVSTTLTYGTYHLVASIADPLTHTISFGYDMKGGLTSLTNAVGNTATFVPNAAGQTVMSTDAAGTTFYTYQGGLPASVTDPLGFTSRNVLDSAGRVLATTDALGRTTRFEYDALDRPLTVIDPLGGATQLTYDPNGNLLSYRDARGGMTSYTYNNMDRVATRTDPLLRDESYLYDLAGNLLQLTDRKGQVTTYQYDALNRRTQASYAGGRTVSYTYDAASRLTQVVDSASGTIVRGFDGLDRLTSETSLQGTIGYTYDAAGRRTTMTVTGQPTVTYDYDDADRLTQITRDTTTVGFTYDAANRRSTMTLPNGVTVEYGYDAASQLTGLTYKVAGNTIGTLTYTYDANGMRTEVGGSFARTRLPLPLASATYNAANQLTQWGSATLTYDANGNLATDGGRSYTWDGLNRLASINDGATGSFEYDGLGRRVGRTIAGATTGYLHDGSSVVQELNGSVPIANLLLGPEIDEELLRLDGSGARTLLADALGSTLALLDASGDVRTEYTYGAFGGTTASGDGSGNLAQFAGRENDGSGLYYYRARYYNPGTQRFLSEDALGLLAGPNLYAYVGNSPLNFIDPLGLDPTTKDENVRKCMCDLFKLAGFGNLRTERAAWIVQTDAGRGCVAWPWSAADRQETWPKGKELPEGVRAIVHTHPYRTGAADRKPSGGDQTTADKINMPVYVVTDEVWKATPKCKNPTKVEDKDWQKSCKF